MLRAFRAVAVGAFVLPVVTGCTVTSVIEEPDPAAIPTGEPVAVGAEATGPITVLGSGQAFELGWRYLIYESEDGWCTELQMAEVNSTGCGPDLLPPEGENIGSAGALEPLQGGFTPVAGIVSEEVFTVWVIDQAVGRQPALLMPLDDAGLEGQAFLAFMPADVTPTHIQALARSGEVLQTYELP